MIKVIDQNSKKVEFDSAVFPGGEVHVRFTHPGLLTSVVTIFALVDSSEEFMKLLLVTDALRQAEVDKIHLILPYFPYARQDRVCNPGEALSVRVAADIINLQNYSSVTLNDPHSYVTPALLRGRIHVITLMAGLSEFRTKSPTAIHPATTWLVAPDAGAEKKVIDASKRLGFNYMQARKIRDVATGKILKTVVEWPEEGFKGDENLLIVDDIADGGRTFLELGKELKKKTTGKILLYVSHGIFSQGFDIFTGVIDEIYVDNPFPALFEKGVLPRDFRSAPPRVHCQVITS